MKSKMNGEQNDVKNFQRKAGKKQEIIFNKKKLLALFPFQDDIFFLIKKKKEKRIEPNRKFFKHCQR